MAGLIQQLTDITLTATPSVGSYLLSIDLDGVLKYKTDTGTISPVGFNGGGSVSIDLNQIAFGTNTGITSSGLFSIDTTDNSLRFGLTNSIFSLNSLVLGGSYNQVNNSIWTTNLGGYCNNLNSLYASSIIGGYKNQMFTQSNSSSIIGGTENQINFYSNESSIIGGQKNIIYNNSCQSSIVGGCYNTICCSKQSTIIGGLSNNLRYGSQKASIVGGDTNIINYGSEYSSILGGSYHIIYNSRSSSIIGGKFATMSNSCCSVILGGQNLQLTNQDDTVLVPNLFVAGSISPNSGNNFGMTVDYQISGSTFSFVNGILVNITS